MSQTNKHHHRKVKHNSETSETDTRVKNGSGSGSEAGTVENSSKKQGSEPGKVAEAKAGKKKAPGTASESASVEVDNTKAGSAGSKPMKKAPGNDEKDQAGQPAHKKEKNEAAVDTSLHLGDSTLQTPEEHKKDSETDITKTDKTEVDF